MSRYARLYACFLRFSFVKAMEFRFDFFFRVGMDLLWNAVQFAFFELLFLQTDSILGWNHGQVRLFVGAMFLSDALHMTVFSNNMWWFPLLVNRGDLDAYLVRPTSTLFFISVREFAANSLLNLLAAIAIFIVLANAYPEPISWGRYLLFGTMLACGVFLLYCLNLLFLLPVFWMHNAGGLRELWFGLSRYFHRPDPIYRGWVRRIFTTVLPVAVVASFPARMLFEANPWPTVLHLLLVTAGCFAAMVWVWRRGLRAYSSASS